MVLHGLDLRDGSRVQCRHNGTFNSRLFKISRKGVTWNVDSIGRMGSDCHFRREPLDCHPRLSQRSFLRRWAGEFYYLADWWMPIDLWGVLRSRFERLDESLMAMYIYALEIHVRVIRSSKSSVQSLTSGRI